MVEQNHDRRSDENESQNCRVAQSVTPIGTVCGC